MVEARVLCHAVQAVRCAGLGVLGPVDEAGHPGLEQVKGDIRDQELLRRVLPGCDAVVHLACISNDPSFELDRELGKSINYDAFIALVKESKVLGVSRFIYASSSSVYGIKDEDEVTEDLELEPLTDYSKFKVLCEEILEEERAPGFVTCTIRPSTVCGYAPRQRLDLDGLRHQERLAGHTLLEPFPDSRFKVFDPSGYPLGMRKVVHREHSPSAKLRSDCSKCLTLRPKP